MPVHKVKGGGYEYGDQKIYKGKDAKKKAIKQGLAIKYSEARKKGLSKPTPAMLKELSKKK